MVNLTTKASEILIHQLKRFGHELTLEEAVELLRQTGQIKSLLRDAIRGIVIGMKRQSNEVLDLCLNVAFRRGNWGHWLRLKRCKLEVSVRCSCLLFLVRTDLMKNRRSSLALKLVAKVAEACQHQM